MDWFLSEQGSKQRFSLLIAFLLFSLVLEKTGWVQAGEGEQAISCVSAYKLGAWSLSKTPLSHPVSPLEPAFVAKALHRYLDLADPHKVLFLQSEVDAFVEKGRGYWQAFAQGGNCSGFETAMPALVKSGRARLEAVLAALPLEKSVQKLAKVGDEDTQFPVFRHYAKTEKELVERLRETANAVGAGVNQYQLASFNGDRRAVVVFSLQRIFFEDASVSPINLLARAFVSTVDPFSDYFTDAQFADFYRELTGGTSGIGVKVRDVRTGLLIQKLVSGSPAAESKKLLPGEIITHVDGKALSELPASQWKHVLEGPENSPVELTLDSKTGGGTKKVSILRRTFAYEDERVETRLIGLHSHPKKKVALISVPSFYGRGGNSLVGERSSSEDVEKALVRVMKSKPAAVVLDLRGNPGGYLEEAVTMGGLFLGSQPTNQRLMRDYRERALYTGPLLVLVDEQSASSAEVLVGALKDYRRAVVIGSPRTYGKGSVQRLFHLDGGMVDLADADRRGVLKVTTSFFYSPLGTTPAAGGLTPDITLSPKSSSKKFSGRSRPVQQAPSHGPFLEPAQVAELRQREKEVSDRIRELKTSTDSQTDEVREVFNQTIRKAFAGIPLDENGKDALAKALAVADDLVAKELRRATSPTPTKPARLALPVASVQE